MWAAVIILCREILVSGLREFLAELNVKVHVTQLAKWKTTMQMIALGVLLAGPAGDKLVPGVTATGLVMLWFAALLTLWTGYDYLKAAVAHGHGALRRSAHARSRSAISPGCARRSARPRRCSTCRRASARSPIS